MHAKLIRFAIAVLFTAAAWGQTVGGEVFRFTHAQAQVDIQQITNAVRSVGEITQASLDTGAKTLTVNGTPQQMALAAWMFSTMDQAAPANYATQEFRPAGSVDDVVRVMYLSQAPTAQGFQEIINSVRTISGMTKVFPYSAQNALVMRGSDSQVAMAEWLFHQLDLPAGLQAGVRVQQFIVACARWRIRLDEIHGLDNQNRYQQFIAMQHLRGKRGLPRWTLLRESDNLLPVDLDNPLSVDAFLQLLKRAKECRLQEMYPTPEDMCVCSNEGRFSHEFIVPLQRPSEATTTPKPSGTVAQALRAAPATIPFLTRTYSPGSEWLYLKIYGGPFALERMLSSLLPPLLKNACENKLITRWYYVRYMDPDFHLRLRFNGNREGLYSVLLPRISTLIEPLLESQSLVRFSI